MNSNKARETNKPNSNLILSRESLSMELLNKVVCSNCGQNTMGLEILSQIGLESEVSLQYKKCSTNNCSLIQKSNNNTATIVTKTQHKFFTSGLNYQAVLATYYTGSTVGNIHFIYSSLGLDNLSNWEYLHYYNCEEVQDKILTLTEDIVSRALISEIIKTMEVKYNMTIKQVNDFFQTKNEKQKTHSL